MSEADNEPADVVFEPLLQLEMEMTTFLSDWHHCDQLSTFIARIVSHNRTDPVRHSNVFSSVLNELLEVSFRGGSPDGQIDCVVYRHGVVERVKLTFPCPPHQRKYVGEAVSKTRRADALARYLNSISTDLAPNQDAIFLYLAINFDARIHLENSVPPSVILVVDLPLEGIVN